MPLDSEAETIMQFHQSELICQVKKLVLPEGARNAIGWNIRIENIITIMLVRTPVITNERIREKSDLALHGRSAAARKPAGASVNPKIARFTLQAIVIPRNRPNRANNSHP